MVLKLFAVVSLKGKDAELQIGTLTSFVKINRLQKVTRKDYKTLTQSVVKKAFDYTEKGWL